MLIMRCKIIKTNTMKIIVKNRKILKIDKLVCIFLRNPIYPLPREGLFLHISVATITKFPGTSLISLNQMG